MFFVKVEILSNGRLIVDGGNRTGDGGGSGGKSGGETGGAGGIIQIISPMGNLSSDSLSLAHGTSRKTGQCGGEGTKSHGYYHLQGMSIQWSVIRLDNFLISTSTAVPTISEPGYFHINTEGDTVIWI